MVQWFMFATESRAVSPHHLLLRPSTPGSLSLNAGRGDNHPPAKHPTLQAVSILPAITCGLFARSWAHERTLTLVISMRFALFRENGGGTPCANTASGAPRPPLDASKRRVWAPLGAHVIKVWALLAA